MVPVIGLVQVGLQRMADRYTYIPLIGLFIVVAWGLADISDRWSRRKKMVGVAGVVLIFFVIISWFQAGTWKNGITLFSHAVKITQNNSVAYCGLGQAFDRQGNYTEAVRYYIEALRINPNHVEAHYELGVSLESQGHSTEALKHYFEALRMKPNYAKVHNNIGVILSNHGKKNEAIDHYRRAIQIIPNYAPAYYNLGIIFAKEHRIKEAISNYKKALQFNFNMTQALYQLSWILATCEDETLRNGEEAINLADRLCKLTRYTLPLALDSLAAAYAESGKFDMAVLTAQKGLELAKKEGPKELALGLKNRLAFYKKGEPYRQNLDHINES